VVDAKAVAAGAVPRKLPPVGVAPAPQIAKPDLFQLVHKMRRRVDRAGLVDDRTVDPPGMPCVEAQTQRSDQQQSGGPIGLSRLANRTLRADCRYYPLVL
jgi:hypothetical protein